MIEAGELGEIRHFRGRYLQDWGDDPTLDTWRFHPDEAGSGALGDLGTHVVDLARFLVGEIETVSGFAKTFVKGRTVDDAIEAAVEFENGAVGTIEATRLALGRRNAFQWEINGSKGSLAFDMERLNELQVFRADGDRARGFKTVLVSEADHPFWEYWWPPGHIIGWGDTFVHELHHLLQAIADDTRRRPVRRDLRGRLPRRRGLRRDRALRARPAHASASSTARSNPYRFDLVRRGPVSLSERRAWPCRPGASNASAKRSSGTRRPTICSSASCQRSRARSSAASAGEPVLALRADAAEDDAVLEHRVERRARGPSSVTVCSRPSMPIRHATPPRRSRPRLSAISCASPAASTTRSKLPSSRERRRPASRRSARRRPRRRGSSRLE